MARQARPIDVLVSAIVPVLNDAAPLAALLEGLAGCRGLEVIVVNGGSRDDPASVCRRFGVRCVAARWGRAAQMRAGIACAGGTHHCYLRRRGLVRLDARAAEH